MAAKIKQLSKRTTQNAPIGIQKWVIEFTPEDGAIYSDKLTGWLSSNDMKNEINLKFLTLEAAETFAKENNIEYEILQPGVKKLVKRAYSDNFK